MIIAAQYSNINCSLICDVCFTTLYIWQATLKFFQVLWEPGGLRQRHLPSNEDPKGKICMSAFYKYLG